MLQSHLMFHSIPPLSQKPLPKIVCKLSVEARFPGEKIKPKGKFV